MTPDEPNSDISCDVKTCKSIKTNADKPEENLQTQTIENRNTEQKSLDHMVENKNEDHKNIAIPQNNVTPTETIEASNDKHKIMENKAINEHDEELFVAQTDMTQLESNEKLQKKNETTHDDSPISNNIQPSNICSKLKKKADDEQLEVHPNVQSSNVPCQKSNCRGPVCDREKVKLKLEESDTPSDFLLLEGPVYVRKSLIKSTDPEITMEPQSTPIQATDSEMGLENCKKCCLQRNSCAKIRLKACGSDIDAIVKAYQSKYERKSGGEEEQLTKDSKFYLQLTHGDADGDDKYHYLMVDTTTSYSDDDYMKEQLSMKLLSPKISQENIASEKSSLGTNMENLSSEKSSHTSEEEEPIKKPLTPIIKQEKPPSIELSSPATTTETPPTEPEEKPLNPILVYPKQNVQIESEINVIEVKKPAPQVQIEPEEKKEPSESETNEQNEGEAKKEVEMKSTFPEHTDIVLDDLSNTEHPTEDRRISILMNRKLWASKSTVDEEHAESNRERRVSAVSWRSAEPLPVVTPDTKVPQSDSLERIAETSTLRSEKTKNANQQPGRHTSVFQDIIREEKRKSISKKVMAVIPDDVLKKSIVAAKSPIPIKKARCCGLIKAKLKKDKPNNDDIQSFDEQIDEENNENDNSNRSSLDSYRRRSSSVENPVSEKNKEINKYLNNV